MRSRAVLVVALLLSMVAAGCRPARVGSRCSTTDWGEQGQWVLRCVRGRWVPVLTKGDAARIILSARPTTTTSTTTTTVFVPTTPEEQRVHDLMVAIYGPSYWASQVMSIPWRVQIDPIMSGIRGQVDCHVRGWGSRMTIWAEGIIVMPSDLPPSDEELGDLLAHEGAHLIACYRWPQTMAPPGFPPALDGSPPGESFAECFARYMRGPDYEFTYGCPNDELPALATQAAVP